MPILLIILLLPVLAICKIIANKTGISFLLLTSYVLTWLFCLFLYYVDSIKSLWTVFCAPFISHFSMIFTIDLIKRSFRIIFDWQNENK